MLWTIVVVILILWALGWNTATAGSLIHVLLVIALIGVLYQLFWSGRVGGPPPP